MGRRAVAAARDGRFSAAQKTQSKFGYLAFDQWRGRRQNLNIYSVALLPKPGNEEVREWKQQSVVYALYTRVCIPILRIRPLSAMSVKATKDETINVRATKDTKQQLDRAAGLLGVSRTSFIIESAMKRALDVIEKHHTVTLSDRDRDTFLELLEEDTPNEELKEAARRREELFND